MAFTFARRRDLSQSLKSGPIAFSMGVIGIFALATVAGQCSPIGPSPVPEIPAKAAAEKKPAPARATD